MGCSVSPWERCTETRLLESRSVRCFHACPSPCLDFPHHSRLQNFSSYYFLSALLKSVSFFVALKCNILSPTYVFICFLLHVFLSVLPFSLYSPLRLFNFLLCFHSSNPLSSFQISSFSFFLISFYSNPLLVHLS